MDKTHMSFLSALLPTRSASTRVKRCSKRYVKREYSSRFKWFYKRQRLLEYISIYIRILYEISQYIYIHIHVIGCRISECIRRKLNSPSLPTSYCGSGSLSTCSATLGTPLIPWDQWWPKNFKNPAILP